MRGIFRNHRWLCYLIHLIKGGILHGHTHAVDTNTRENDHVEARPIDQMPRIRVRARVRVRAMLSRRRMFILEMSRPRTITSA